MNYQKRVNIRFEDEKYRLMALEDEDLEGVREDLLNLGWGETVV